MPANASTGVPERGKRLRIRLKPAVKHRQAARLRRRSDRVARPRPRRPPAAHGRGEAGRERRAQRARRKHLAVADAAAAVDHQDREVLVQPRTLEAVVHHDRAGAGRARGVRAGDAVARHDGGREPRQQQRLVADLGRAMRAGSTCTGPGELPP